MDSKITAANEGRRFKHEGVMFEVHRLGIRLIADKNGHYEVDIIQDDQMLQSYIVSLSPVGLITFPYLGWCPVDIDTVRIKIKRY